MRLLALAVLISGPAMFGQARGSGRPAAPGAHRVAPPLSRGAAAPAPLAPVRPAAQGYYPNLFYYGIPVPLDEPDESAPAPPPAYYGADPAGQGYPAVLVNPNYVPETARPVMRDYSYLSSSGNDSASAGQAVPSVYFLIAMKDHVIYPAIAYWVQNDSLNYITRQGERKQVPLAQVDRDFSTQLNKDRNIDFALPQVNAN